MAITQRGASRASLTASGTRVSRRATAERRDEPPRRLGLIAAPVLLSLFLAAMDSTVVGTLLPTIREQLHDATIFPWLLSGFLLATALAIPLAGALADRYSEKAVMLASLALFAAGSLAVCLAPTMVWLVGARVAQGLGAGGLIVMAYVMLGRAFTGERRARMQGLLSTVWGLAAILGPSLGLMVQAELGWRAVFAINLPVTALAMFLVLRLAPVTAAAEDTKSHVDARAFALLTIFLCSLLLLIMSSGLSLTPGVVTGLAAALAVSLVLQIGYLRPRRDGGAAAVRADRSVLPLPLLTERRYLVAGVITLLAAAALYGSVTLLPLYLKLRGASATLDSGTVVTLGAIGWVVGSAACGLLVGRLGYRGTAVAGGLLLTIGAVLLWIPAAPSLATAGIAQVSVGLGTGFVTATTLIYIQTMCAPERLGAFTGGVNLLRNVGAAIGINTLASIQIGYAKHSAAAAVNPRQAAILSFRHGFLIMALGTAGCVLAALLMPGRQPSAPAKDALATPEHLLERSIA